MGALITALIPHVGALVVEAFKAKGDPAKADLAASLTGVAEGINGAIHASFDRGEITGMTKDEYHAQVQAVVANVLSLGDEVKADLERLRAGQS